MAELKNRMVPTGRPVEEFLAEDVIGRRADEARVLIPIYERITGEPAAMWGPSIIGFGQTTYETKAGTGIVPQLAFSPRKAQLTIYFGEGFAHHEARLTALGPHKASTSCLYVTRLERIDLDVLTAMLEDSWQITTTTRPNSR